jgi:predicted permease
MGSARPSRRASAWAGNGVNPMKKWLRFWQRQRRDDDLRRELDAYLEQEVANQIAAGRSPEDAQRAAHRKLGNVTRIRESLYEQNSLLTLDTLWRDLAYAARLLRRNPGFAAVAILSIALGIGATASVFTLLDQVILRTLPVSEPRQLVLITAEGQQYGNAWGYGNELSFPMYEDLRDNNQVFSGMFGRITVTVDTSVDGSAERAQAELVTGTYFSVLGIPASMGRVLHADDDRAPGGHPLVVLSHRYWRDRFQSDPAVVGTVMRLNHHPMTVVGVAREGFYGTNLGSATEIFVPLMMSGELTSMINPLTDRRMRWVNVFGRLKPSMNAEAAQVGLQPFYSARLAFEAQQDAFARASSTTKEKFLKGTIGVEPAPYGRSELRSQLSRPLWTLIAIGVGVLIIACANVANLLLARATTRQREMAVRLALGAARGRVIRQLLVESVLLALIGGAAGLVLATWGAQSLLAFFTQPDVTLTITPWPDARVLAISVAVCVTAGVLFGLAPAWQSTRQDVTPVLKSESGNVLGGGYARLRKGLVVAQVALSLLLLAGAGLFIRSLQNLLAVDPGFDRAQVLSFNVSPGTHGYDPVQQKTFAVTLWERVRATPGVSGAGFVSNRLLEGSSWNTSMTIEGREHRPEQRVLTHNNLVSPGYFDAMGIRLLAGRDFDLRDQRHVEPGSPVQSPSVVIANEQFVKQFLNGRQAVGLHIGFGGDPGTPTPMEIVGVVSTAAYTSIRSEPAAQLYFPYLEAPSVRGLTMYVRTAQRPESMSETMRQIVREMDPSVPLHDVLTVEDQINQSLVNDRLVASLSTVLGVLATTLAMVGLYGVMSYVVARRTREMAIRVAFGALGSRVVALIAREMLVLAIGGMLLAIPAIWWLQRYVRSELYEVSPADPTALASAGLLLLAATLVAVWVPSRRALRISPIIALREE